MTEIDFYFHVEDKLRTACVLSAKAVDNGLRVFACCPNSETSVKFSGMLWTSPALSFIPHCMASDKLASRTAVVIDDSGTEPPCDQVLLNLGTQWPRFFSRFRRLIEIVTIEEEDRQLARERFKFYRDRGYAIRSHDLSKRSQ